MKLFFHDDVELIPFVLLDASSGLVVLINIEHAVDVCPFLYSSIPALQSLSKIDEQEDPLTHSKIYIWYKEEIDWMVF